MTTQSELVSIISAAVGIILSLATTYYKPLATWFYNIPENFRGLATVGINFLAAIAVFGISCSQLFGLVPCTQQTAVDLFRAVLYMIVANQATYMLSPTSPTKRDIEQAKLASYTAEFKATADALKAEKETLDKSSDL